MLALLVHLILECQMLSCVCTCVCIYVQVLICMYIHVVLYVLIRTHRLGQQQNDSLYRTTQCTGWQRTYFCDRQAIKYTYYSSIQLPVSTRHRLSTCVYIVIVLSVVLACLAYWDTSVGTITSLTLLLKSVWHLGFDHQAYIASLNKAVLGRGFPETECYFVCTKL